MAWFFYPFTDMITVITLLEGINMKKLLVLMLTSILLVACSSDEPKGGDKQKIEEKEDNKQKIDVDEEIELNGATVKVKSVTIEDDTARIYFIWKHWTQYDKAHMDLLLTTSVMQDEEYLDITNNEDKFLKQINKGVDGPMMVDYKLKDNETPIDIKFTETTDEMKSETVTIEID